MHGVSADVRKVERDNRLLIYFLVCCNSEDRFDITLWIQFRVAARAGRVGFKASSDTNTRFPDVKKLMHEPDPIYIGSDLRSDINRVGLEI